MAKTTENPAAALEKLVSVTRAASTSSRPPIETYKVDAGDILYINLLNAPKASGLFPVRGNGTIDYPLAATNFRVSGLTTDEIGINLAAAIKLYNDPKIEVKVKQFQSHKINLSGLVAEPGEMSIQREAVPLYVVPAAAMIAHTAANVTVKRASGTVEKYELRNTATENVLIFPGDALDFSASAVTLAKPADSFVISGEVKSTGQKAFRTGMTLTQAINSVGGTNGNPKKVKITRRGANGMLGLFDLNLRSIREGKLQDPMLQPGDVVEISK